MSSEIQEWRGWVEERERERTRRGWPTLVKGKPQKINLTPPQAFSGSKVTRNSW